MAAGDLCSLAEVREHLQITDSSETDSDPVIASLITRVSRAIAKDYGREFASTLSPNPGTRRARVRFDRIVAGFYVVDLAPWDLQAATAVKLHPETTAPQTLVIDYDYALEPYEAPDGVYDRIRVSGVLAVASSTVAQRFGWAYLDVTGTWGFAAVPADVKEAAIQAVVLYLRGDVQAFGSALQPNSFGPAVNVTQTWPPGIRGLLAPYRRQLVF